MENPWRIVLFRCLNSVEYQRMGWFYTTMEEAQRAALMDVKTLKYKPEQNITYQFFEVSAAHTMPVDQAMVDAAKNTH